MKKTNQKTFPDKKSVLFSIAGHILDITLPATLDWERMIPSFKPFEIDDTAGKKEICSVRIIETPIRFDMDTVRVLDRVSGVMGHFFCLMESEEHYIVEVQFVENGNLYQMKTNKNFSDAIAYVDRNDECAGIILSWFMMITFTHSAILHQTLVIHASIVEKDGKGYAFLGKSGTGKSTHSALWIRYIEGTALLNDDNPAIRIDTDGHAYVYGTPWSGKTPCYQNRRAPLKALVRLIQAKANHFTWKKGSEALITLLPSCSSMRWNTLLYNEMCNRLEEVVRCVMIGVLECLPDEEAALLCYKEMERI